jgi:hypothetical protein
MFNLLNNLKMKKSFLFVCSMLAVVTMMLTGCKDTKALQAAIDEAAKACPIALDNLGEATAITLGENEVEFNVTPVQALMENDKVDHSLIARYLVLELQRKNPELVKQMVEAGFGVKCNLSGAEGEEPILVAADELKKFNGEFEAAGGQIAPILLPLYNQQLSAKLPIDIAEGLSLTKVKVVDGCETFFITVDDDKAKFADVRAPIAALATKIDKAGKSTPEDIAEKVKYSKINLTLLLPLLNELNYSAMFRYSTKAGNETYMELTAEEIDQYLHPVVEEAKEEAQ